MNILIPHNWLLDHLETKASPTDIQRLLSLAGPSVERIYDRAGESVYDIEVTTNRVDSMSVRGIAREAAIILAQAGMTAKLKPLPTYQEPKSTKHLPLPKINQDPNLSRRVTCVLLTNCQRTATPDWMAERLTQVEQNIHDAVIDITNYVTHDLGHPCHAFDYDKLMKTGGQIIIAEAKSKESFTTLDGNSFTTVGGEVVFRNGKGEIIDLPSIKGTANTSVDDSTTNILLLMESIKPEKVRFASMTHNIRTVAAQLMEKGVDPHLMDEVMQSVIHLYTSICKAKVGSSVYDDFPQPYHPQSIELKSSFIQRYLGITMPLSTVSDILIALGCQVTVTQEPEVEVISPSFRPDLQKPVDLIEELARIYGYQHIPSKLMDSALPLNPPVESTLNIESNIAHFLSLTGWQEVYTYSMVSEELAVESDFLLTEHLKLQNPLSDDRVYLRRSLEPSLREALATNPLHPQAALFEIANVYLPKADHVPVEDRQLCLTSRRPWREVRGTLESLLNHLRTDGLVTGEQTLDSHGTTTIQLMVDLDNNPIDPNSLASHPEQISLASHADPPQADDSASSNSGSKQKSGTKSIVSSTTTQSSINLGHLSVSSNGITTAQLSIAVLARLARSHPTYQPLPKTSVIKEDLTLTIPANQTIGAVLSTLQNTSSLVTSVDFKEIYQRNATFTITYYDPEQHLSGETVAPIRKQLVAAVKKNHNAILVGTLQ